MVNQFLESWRINNRVNLMLLDEISADKLNITLSNPSNSPARQFAHIHNVRYWRLEKMNKELARRQGKIARSDELCHELLRLRLLKSADSIAHLLEEGFNNNGELKGFRRGVFAFMGYLIAHEAHHRGNMILMLKQCGYKLSKSLTYGIWDWNKI